MYAALLSGVALSVLPVLRARAMVRNSPRLLTPDLLVAVRHGLGYPRKRFLGESSMQTMRALVKPPASGPRAARVALNRMDSHRPPRARRDDRRRRHARGRVTRDRLARHERPLRGRPRRRRPGARIRRRPRLPAE